MFWLGIRIAAVILCVAPGSGASAAATDLPSFQGKTITMLTGDDPGGGTDAAGRLIALYLHKYLAGAPTIVVQNMSGANGMTAMNYFVRRTDPNGLTLLIGSIPSIHPLVYRNANAQYDPRSFRFRGGIGRGGSVLLTNKAADCRVPATSRK